MTVAINRGASTGGGSTAVSGALLAECTYTPVLAALTWPLDGSHSYALTFPPHRLPPVRGFWSLTLYNEHHFFHPNELNRYSLGTKNKNLHHATDGSLTLTASAIPPDDDDLRTNWLPAPAGQFSLYLRAYWPEQQILNGTWAPPPVARFH